MYRSVRDVHGREYRLQDVLAEGGEGMVLRTEHPRILVKLRPPEASLPIEEVLRADLGGIPVCRPQARIAPPSDGYVMHLVRDSEPLDRLRRPAGLAGPDLAPWYRESGGARRRLRALAGLASAVGALHGRGLCVADISPNNVLVPLTHTDPSPALIDPDNLHAPGDVEVRRFTRPYVAPEVFRGVAPCSMRSDVYALALLIVEILTLWFPFFGDALLAGPPEDEDRALRGELPWIHDSRDRTNAAAGALPPKQFLGERLTKLARRTFEQGRQELVARPSAMAWARGLHVEADGAYRCACENWNMGHWTVCMCCGAERRPAVTLRIVGEQRELPIHADGARLLRRHFMTGQASTDAATAEIGLHLRPTGLRLESIGTVPCRVTPGGALLQGFPITVAPGAAARLDFDDRRAEVQWA